MEYQMRKTASYIFFLFLLINLTGCQKDKTEPVIEEPTYDTLFPKDYFPAWPGSQWVYNDTDTVKVNAEFELVEWTDEYGLNAQTKWVPRISSTAVREYEISGVIDVINLKGRIISDSENEGDNWSDFAVTGNSRLNAIINTDTSITVNEVVFDNVLVVRVWSEAAPDPLNPYATYNYFAKDVGLIKSHRADWPDSTVFVTELKAFSINN